jgi:hypothetical protein
MRDSMKKSKLIIISLVVAILLSCVAGRVLTANATEEVEVQNNIKKMTTSERSDFVKGLITDIINNSTTNIANYTDSFTEEQLSKFILFINNNSIDGTLNTTIIDEITSNCSATSDTVLMCNFRLNISNGYNNVYMMELHVNNEGKIYGYNIWAF